MLPGLQESTQATLLNQPRTFGVRWILGTTSGAAVVPDTYRLQAGDADDATSFDNHSIFHDASLERPPGGRNALFGEGANSQYGKPVTSTRRDENRADD